MPGGNCAIFGCPVSRSKKYAGVAIFRVTRRNDEYNNEWRKKIYNIITKDRVVDSKLKEQMDKQNIFICERHFSQECLNFRKLWFTC